MEQEIGIQTLTSNNGGESLSCRLMQCLLVMGDIIWKKYQFTFKNEHIIYRFHHSHDRIIQMVKFLREFCTVITGKESLEIYNSKISKFLWP